MGFLVAHSLVCGLDRFSVCDLLLRPRAIFHRAWFKLRDFPSWYAGNPWFEGDRGFVESNLMLVLMLTLILTFS